MASSFEKSVKGATKVKLAPPKTKYIEHILIATHSGEFGVGEVFRALQKSIHDTAWTTVFKSLITVHLMIREGSPNVTLAYLAHHRGLLMPSAITDGQIQGRNIRHYATYLSERAKAYRDTKIDWVRARESILEKLTVEKGLLRETEAVQYQLTALLKCDVVESEPENEITIFVFRLLVLDLLSLFQVLNQAMINILGHFFEMSKVDAERAMQIYRTFTKQTDYVVQYLTVARQFEHQTRVEVPKLKHAPVNLGRQLEEYLQDPDFETHRRQYLAELAAKKNKGSSGSGSGIKLPTAKTTSDSASNQTSQTATPTPKAAAAEGSSTAKPSKGPDPDLIDFFGSIEQNQTTLNIQQQPQPPQVGASPWGATGMYQVAQPTGFQSTNPFQMQATGVAFSQPQQPQALQAAYTGVGFNGLAAQQQMQQQQMQQQQMQQQQMQQQQMQQQQMQQQQMQQQQQQQQMLQVQQAAFQQNTLALPQVAMPTGSTNPFRQSMLAPATTGPAASPLVAAQTGSTNPFARASMVAPSTTGPTATPLVAMRTGTNPFARDYASPQLAQRPATSAGAGMSGQAANTGALVPQPTGTTNPFRQTAFINQQTGMGWQHSQPTGNLLEQLETVPVFPRPAQQTPWQ